MLKLMRRSTGIWTREATPGNFQQDLVHITHVDPNADLCKVTVGDDPNVQVIKWSEVHDVA